MSAQGRKQVQDAYDLALERLQGRGDVLAMACIIITSSGPDVVMLGELELVQAGLSLMNATVDTMFASTELEAQVGMVVGTTPEPLKRH